MSVLQVESARARPRQDRAAAFLRDRCCAAWPPHFPHFEMPASVESIGKCACPPSHATSAECARQTVCASKLAAHVRPKTSTVEVQRGASVQPNRPRNCGAEHLCVHMDCAACARASVPAVGGGTRGVLLHWKGESASWPASSRIHTAISRTWITRAARWCVSLYSICANVPAGRMGLSRLRQRCCSTFTHFVRCKKARRRRAAGDAGTRSGMYAETT